MYYVCFIRQWCWTEVYVCPFRLLYFYNQYYVFKNIILQKFTDIRLHIGCSYVSHIKGHAIRPNISSVAKSRGKTLSLKYFICYGNWVNMESKRILAIGYTNYKIFSISKHQCKME